MRRLSSKSSLLAGVSALVLASAVDLSVASARNVIVLSSGNYATLSPARSGTNLFNPNYARANDSVELRDNSRLTINNRSNDADGAGFRGNARVRINKLSGAGRLYIGTGQSGSVKDVDVEIRQIDGRNVALELRGEALGGAIDLKVTGNATLQSLNIAGHNRDVSATFAGNVDLGSGLNLGNGIITFGGSGNQTIKADIRNSTGKQGFVVVNNSGGTVTFEDAVGASGNGNDLAGLTVRDGVARFKGDVFAGVLLVESTDGAEFRGNVTTGALGISFAGNDAAKITLNGAVNQIVTGDITTDSDGRGLLVVNNSHATTNKVTFGGSVGADGTALKQITLSAGRTTFHSGVYADTINITTSDATVFKGHVKAGTRFRLGNGSSVTFNGTSGQTVTGDITRAAGGNYGKIIVANTHADGVTFAGQLGASGQKLNRVTLNDDSNATFEGSVYLANGLKLGDDATITFGGSGNQTIKADIRNSTGKRGSVVVNNSGGTVTFEDAVGATGDANHLARLTVSDGVAVFDSHVFAQGLVVSSTDGAQFKGNITTGSGGILFTGHNDAKITLDGAVNQIVTGDITTESDGRGLLVVNNAHATTNKVTFGRSVGADGRALKQITLDNGQTTFNGGVYADTINITTTDATTFKGHVKAGTGANEGIKLGARSGSVTFGGTTGQTVAGNITSAAGGNYGAIIIANTHADGVSFKGSLGASGANNGLSRVTLNNNVKAAFAGNVYLGNGLTFGNGSQVTFNGTESQTVAGNITSASGGNYGTITIDNDDGVTFKGALGASGANNGLNRLTLNDDSSATFEGHVYLANGLKLGNSTITFGGSGNQTIEADIRNSTGKRGSVVVNNSGTTNRTVTFEDAVGATGVGNDLALITVSDGVARFKGDVFAQSVGVSSTDGAEFKGNVTTGRVGILFAGHNEAKITLNGTANQTVTGDITPDSDGRGLLVVNNAGATNSNKVTFHGSVGADGTALKQITLSAGRTTFHSGVYADTINITTTDATVFKGHVKAETGIKLGNNSGSVTFSGTAGQTVTGNITTDANNQGSIIIANTHAEGVSFKGSLGTNSAKLANLTLRGNATAANASRASFAGNVYLNGNLTLGENTRVTLNGSGDQQISATITNGGTAGRGDIVVNNSGGTVTFANAVGGSGGALKQITLDDGQTVFEGAVYAGTITVNSADGTTFNGAVSATTFKFGASATANSRVTFGGSTAQTITPAITTDSANSGAITIANTAGVTFEGNLGATNAKLARLTLHTGTKATLEQSGYFAGNVTLRNRATLIVGDASDVTGTNGRGTGVRDAQTITGNIVAGDDGQGDLEIRNRSSHATGQKVSFTGSIGTAEAALNRITVADGETTFGGDVYAGNLNITARDATTFKGNVYLATGLKLGQNTRVRFNGTDSQTVAGNITSASGGNYGTIIIDNDDGVTFEGALGASGANNGLRSLTVNEDAKVTFNQPVYLSGDLTAHRKSTLTLGPAFGQREGDAADQAFITVGGDFNLGTADADNSVRIAFDSSFTEGEQKLINKDLSAAIDNGKLILVESNVLKYELATDDGGSVIARAKGFKSAGEVSSKLGVSPSEATVLLAASSLAKDLPANDPVKKILQEAAQAGNEAKGKRLAAQLTPQMTALGGATAAVVSTGTQVAGVLSERLSVQRGGDSQSGFVQSGFATGGEGLDRAFWLKPFGSRGKQAKDKKQRIDGYDTSARGLAVGVDAPVGERGRVGTALAYSTSRMTGKGVGEDKTDVRSWQVSVYGDYSTGRYYVDGQVGVGRNDVSTTSRVAGLRRKAAYDTTSLTASVGGGVPINLDASTTLTPTAGLSWTRVGSANYTTTGALSLNQKITVGSIDAVVGTLGTRIQRDITRKHSNRTLVPVARVGLSYDFAGEQMTARGRFTGGGSRFTVKGAKVRKLSGTAGVGLSYSAPRWSIGADYDLSARPGYTGHSARLNARVKF